MILTADKLKAIIPGISPSALSTFQPLFESLLPMYDIDTPARIGAFIAQTAHESANFTALTEFASGSAYEGRTDLGNTQPGDGVKFKGRGLIQITGRSNYLWCSKSLFKDNRLIDAPELLVVPSNAIRSACWYWTVARPTLNFICDQPEGYTHSWRNPHGVVKEYGKIEWITVLINGGQNGIAERKANYERARIALDF